jgi:hypothetical protein
LAEEGSASRQEDRKAWRVAIGGDAHPMTARRLVVNGLA